MSTGPTTVVTIWGASGATGQELLRQCLADERVGDVRAFVRHEMDVEHAKLSQHVVDDFLDPQSYHGELGGIDVAFWCLGVSQSAVGDEARYREITLDYTMTAAKALLAESSEHAFHFVSGMGAGSGKGSRPMWARVKGETEEALAAIGFRRLVIWRPGYIDVAGGRDHPTRFERLWEIISPLFRLIPNLVNPTTDIAAAMLSEALERREATGCELKLATDIVQSGKFGKEEAR